MTLDLYINEISLESWDRKDKSKGHAIRLHCADRDNKCAKRYAGEIIVGVVSEQLEFASERLKRDMTVTVELVGQRTIGISTFFEGRIIPESVPALTADRIIPPPGQGRRGAVETAGT